MRLPKAVACGRTCFELVAFLQHEQWKYRNTDSPCNSKITKKTQVRHGSTTPLLLKVLEKRGQEKQKDQSSRCLNSITLRSRVTDHLTELRKVKGRRWLDGWVACAKGQAVPHRRGVPVVCHFHCSLWQPHVNRQTTTGINSW